VTGIREPGMLTGMTERDWLITLEVFDAVQSSRGEPGRDDRKFLEAIHYFTGPQHYLASIARGLWQLEQRIEAVLAAQPIWRIRGILSDSCRMQRDSAFTQ
jgi:hypothetical protein